MSKQGGEGAVFKSSFDEEKEERQSKFMNKAKENPLVPAGIVGGLIALAYSAFKFKSRGNTKMSVYLIHTRVAAQGAVVGAMTLACVYQIFQEYVWTDKNKDKK